MNLFFFEGKNESYLAGITQSLAINTCYLIGSLVGYIIVNIFDVGSISVLYLAIYALNVNFFSNQLYFMTATYFAKAPSYRHKKDFSALIVSFLITLLIAYFAIKNLDLFKVSKEDNSRLEWLAFLTYFIVGGTLLKNKTICGISYTEEKKEVDEKKFILDKKNLKKFQWSWYIFFSVLLGVFFLTLNFYA